MIRYMKNSSGVMIRYLLMGCSDDVSMSSIRISRSSNRQIPTTSLLGYRIGDRIHNSRLAEPFPPDPATVAPAAGDMSGSGIITTVRQLEGNPEVPASPHDLGLRLHQQRCAHLDRTACDAHLGPQVGDRLERADKFRPAIRIAGIVQDIGPEIDRLRVERFGIGECQIGRAS